MLFNSIEFFIFLPVVFGLYYLLQHKFRWALLLAASYYFYMSWKPEYIGLIMVSTLIDYYCGIQLGKEDNKVPRKLFLWISLLSNLGILMTFKYLGFFQEVFNDLLTVLDFNGAGNGLKLILPMGISFYTFQTMSYTIDIYNRKLKPEKHLGIFALFVTFFPQLVAGPIERASNLLPQFRKKILVDNKNIIGGMKLAAWGLFKKVVIADRLSIFVDTVYNNPHEYNGIPLIVATVFFAFQIYCDFSGYSDIAIGVAKMFGFNLMDNFKRPYHAFSISNFWSRWHISLSTWFRDYCYIPLGGNRVVKWRWYYNLFLTFLISGFWHGANWTFIAWGAFHGILLVLEIVFNIKSASQNRLVKSFRIMLTFSLVCLGWIFFRANNLGDAIYIISNLFVNIPGDILSIITNVGFGRSHELYIDQNKWVFIIAVLSIVLMEAVHYLQRYHGLRQTISQFRPIVKWPIYYLFVLIIICFGVFDKSQFIYFQF